MRYFQHDDSSRSEQVNKHGAIHEDANGVYKATGREYCDAPAPLSHCPGWLGHCFFSYIVWDWDDMNSPGLRTCGARTESENHSGAAQEPDS